MERAQRNRRPPERYSPSDYMNLMENKVSVPTTYEEAMKSEYAEYWRAACHEEHRSLLEKQVYRTVNRQDGGRPISTKWVFSLKVNPGDGSIERFKARIVVRGFEQKYGIDYEGVYAPVVAHATIRCFLTHAAVKKMKVHHVDVKTAFLNSELDQEVYVVPPDGLEDGNGIWKLQKGLYGLRQAPKCWFEKIYGILTKLGFKQGKVDQCVFQKGDTGNEIFVLLYVDDLLVASADLEEVKRFKLELAKLVEIRDLGQLKTFLGLQIEFDERRNCFTMSQEKLIADYAEKFNLVDAKQVKRIPQVETIDFGEEKLTGEYATKYKSLIGGLLYVANQTRPDVTFPVNFMSRFMKEPTELHLKYAKRILQYLYATRTRRLYLGKLDETLLLGFSDASFGQFADQKSQSGLLIAYH